MIPRALLLCFGAAMLLGCGEPVKIEPIEGAPEVTEAMLQEFEKAYQCNLPEDYRRFLLQNNGGFPSPDCVMFTEASRKTASDVFCFHCLGHERAWASLEWHCRELAWRLPQDTLPIGHDACGNLWLLNVGPEHSGTVVFWDHGSFENFDETDFNVWPRVASSFQEFLDSLREYRPLPEDDELLSRYALVQQSIEQMRETVPDFNKFSLVDGAWHCERKENGNANMKCVDYELHAIATHTDGYSDLRAAKGFIQSGTRRLPPVGGPSE